MGNADFVRAMVGGIATVAVVHAGFSFLESDEGAVEVVIDEIDETRESVVWIRALAWTETESQKGILIGKSGRMIREIGTAARRELERELGRRVHLDLSVRVRRAWRGDDALLDRLGIT